MVFNDSLIDLNDSLVGGKFEQLAFFYRLRKEVDERATYPELLQHPFLVYHEGVDTDISGFVAEILDNTTAEDEKKSC